MSRRSRMSRFAWLAAAILQLLVPTLWSVEDARVEVASARAATIHVEAPGNSTCPRLHPADCVICQAAAMAAAPKAQASLELPALAVIGRPSATLVRQWPSARAPGDPPQRAPPA
jgi:hypothetical protein